MNRRRKIHYNYIDPCDQIEHDIIFHGNLSHSYKYYFSIPHNNNNNDQKKTEMKETFNKYFDTMHKILQKLKAFYNYDENAFKNKNGNGKNNTKKLYGSLDTELKKLCFCIVLFYVLHEHSEEDTIEYFSETGSILQILQLKRDDIDTNDDPNSPSIKYPIVKNINWRSVYNAVSDILDKLNIRKEKVKISYQ